MIRIRTTTARVALAIALCTWVGASLAGLVHQTLVAHVMCAEHGELVELDHDGAWAAKATAEQPSIGTDPAVLHGHGCHLDGVFLSGVYATPPALSAQLPVPRHRSSRLAMRQAPRGPPPLAYAPKTSPPSAC